MDFGQGQKTKSYTRRREIRLTNLKNAESYPHKLQFYTLPPTENITLQEFEVYAVDRLKVLKTIETVGIRHVKTTDDYKETLLKELRHLKSQGIMKGLTKKSTQEVTGDDIAERRKDHISHFILRLAYCRSEELRRWFIQHELDLFRFCFLQEDDKSIAEFLELNKLDYRPIPKQEKDTIMKELFAAAGGNTTPVDVINYYKVPFIDALDLVKSRKVYLSNGYAYVPHNELVVIILSVFRSNLSHALAVTSRALPQLEEDDRLLPMLSHLSKRYLGQDYSNKKPSENLNINAGMIDSLAKKSFPLCMSSVHQSLRQHHHLKHWGRMQYGLFLKGIGLSLDEAMKFWRTEFTKLVDGDKFDKQYSYNIRHNYGKEGKRADYTPYSCVKIITTNHPGPGDYHGCPFKHTDVDLLKQRLQSLSLSKDGINEIVDNVKSSNYQLACARYFELTHNVPAGQVNVNHPNQYFEESRKVLDETKEGSVSSSQTPRGVKKVPLGNSQLNKTSQQPDNTGELSTMTQDEMSSLFDDMDS